MRVIVPSVSLQAAIAMLMLLLTPAAARAETPPPIKILFLGDQGHHRPAERAAQLIPVLGARGIVIDYTEDADQLNPQTLAAYDGLLVYANIDRISVAQEAALLDFVERGKGFVPVHCASYCFRNSPRYVALVGAQFKSHGTGVFREEIVAAEHPVMRGFAGFESWDETYVHTHHNEQDRTVLSYRVDAAGREPWTWIRTHGQGRVFYTAWGHDQRTWGHPGFQNMIERGIRWAVGADPGAVPDFAGGNGFPVPRMTRLPEDLNPFEYTEAKVPYYPPSERWGTIGEPITKMQLPLAAEESARHMVTPEGFRVRLFAAEPDIVKPICMNWDTRGRLWIAETVDYPNELQAEGEGRDRIKICEDTDGDGRADRFTVFADKLSIPTSLAFAYGGVIVQQAPHTLFLKDSDGDDRADVRRVLFTGWNTRDTHAGPSNLHYGLDNWFWGTQGYAGYDGEVGGEGHQFRQGFFRFRVESGGSEEVPQAAQLEFVRSTNNNTWGLGFSEEGLVFGSTANRHPSIYMPVANRYYERVRGWSAGPLETIADTHRFAPITENVRQVDHHGGYTAGAGHALYTARAYPREYWNRVALVCGPTGHLVGAFVLDRSGGDFRSTSPFNLLASDDEWTAPIMAEVGPDGNVWVIDWYNYIVQHNPTPAGYETGPGNAYATELRDKRHGRIYRVVYEQAEAAAPMSLEAASPPQLLAALAHDNMLWRKHAQRLLVERGRMDVVPQLVQLALDSRLDEIGLNAGVVHALWTLDGLGAMDGSHPEALEAALAALRHRSPGVRRNACWVLPRSEASLEALLEADLVSDPDGQVRLAALLALAEMPPAARAAEVIAALLVRAENYGDRWLRAAATSAAAAHDRFFLSSLAARGAIPDAVRPIISIVAEHYARGAPRQGVGALLEAVADGDPLFAAAVVTGLARGWPEAKSGQADEATDAALLNLLDTIPSTARGQLVKLAARLGSSSLEEHAARIAESLLAVVEDSGHADPRRLDAARQLIEFRADDDQTVAQLLGAVTPRTAPELAAELIGVLSSSEAAGVGSQVVERFDGLTPAARLAAVRVLLARPSSTRALLDGLDSGQINLSDLSLDQKQTLAAHPDRGIARRARSLLDRGGTLPNPDRQKVIDELLPLVSRPGDAAAGKEVFQKQCAKCHTHSGEGTRIGPDLTGMAVHPKPELMTQIIDPSRSVEGNYRAYTVLTTDGRVVNGLLASETKTTIELFDSEGKRQIVLREDIDELVASPKSLMPEGFEKEVAVEDIANLLEFLTQRGQFLPLPLHQAATIVSTQGMFHRKDASAERLVFPDWSPKTFNGVPFHLVDPLGQRTANAILLYGPRGTFPPRMPKSVRLPCNTAAKAIHLLSGVSGWGYPATAEASVSMIVRLHYADAQSEDHPLRNAVHFADYIRRVDVPESELAFQLGNQQLRYLAVLPQRDAEITAIELVKGPDQTAPIVMAVTVETR